ncbi:MAG: 30S ribosomal protein S6 [Chloroflexi bacterium]|nr:30S ribosomal protein S6 [Chloroflexota bacterium]
MIVSPDVAEDDVPDAVDRLIRQPVESEGGELQETDHWGRRKLAYPIQRHQEGNYVLTQLNMDPQKTDELERGLQISEEVLRYLLIRLDE